MNLNYNVIFELNQECSNYNKVAINVMDYEIKDKPNTYKMQLWQFCHEFGPRMMNGLDCEIKNNEVHFEKGC